MNNYKIKVNNESESREAQEYFFALGYVWADTKCQTQMEWTCSCWYSCFEDGDLCLDRYDVNHHHKELCIAELQDLVILHRNDVSDATHVGRSGSEYFVAENDAVFFFDGSEWIEKQVDVNNLKPINKSEEQGLISWADALRALANGEEVLWRTKTNAEVKSFRKQTPDLDLVLSGDCNYRFWIKPRTIKLSLEIPAPFEPKEFEDCYMLTDLYEHGYTKTSWKYKSVPAWRTEQEIKQVVAALRGGIKA